MICFFARFVSISQISLTFTYNCNYTNIQIWPNLHWTCQITSPFSKVCIQKGPFFIPHLMTPGFFYEILHWMPCFLSPVGTYLSFSYSSAPPQQDFHEQPVLLVSWNFGWFHMLITWMNIMYTIAWVVCEAHNKNHNSFLVKRLPTTALTLVLPSLFL